jgi:hypothetical protein
MPQPEDLSKLCRLIGNPVDASDNAGQLEKSRQQSLQYLVERAKAANLLIPQVTLARWLYHSGRPQDPDELAEMVSRESPEAIKQCAAEAWDWLTRSPFDETARRIALALGGEIGPEHLRRQISAAIGPALGHVLLNCPPRLPRHELAVPPNAGWALELITIAIQQNGDVLVRSLKSCAVLPQSARFWLEAVKQANDSDAVIAAAIESHRELKWVRTVLADNPPGSELPEFDCAMAERARMILQQHRQKIDPPEDLRSVAKLRAFLASRPSRLPEVAGECRSTLADTLNLIWNPQPADCQPVDTPWTEPARVAGVSSFRTHESQFFTACLANDLGCAEKPVWRLFFRNHQDRVAYSTDEQQILSELSWPTLLALLLADWPPPSSLRSRRGPRICIEACPLAPVPPGREEWNSLHVRRLLKVAEKHRLSRLGRFCFQLLVWISLVDRATSPESPTLDRDALTGMLRGWRNMIPTPMPRALGQGSEPRPYYAEARRAWRLFYSGGQRRFAKTLDRIWLDVELTWKAHQASSPAASKAKAVEDHGTRFS